MGIFQKKWPKRAGARAREIEKVGNVSVFRTIQDWTEKPFVYGKSDCCQFVGAVVEAMTGNNPMAPFSYNSRAEALAIIREYGTLRDAFVATLGEPVPITEGVILLVNTRERNPMAGVKYHNACVTKNRDGVRDWPLACAMLAWPV